MQRVFDASPALAIHLELFPAGLQAAGSTPEQVFDHLRSSGFAVLHHAGGKLTPLENLAPLMASLPERGYTNLLAVRDHELARELTA